MLLTKHLFVVYNCSRIENPKNRPKGLIEGKEAEMKSALLALIAATLYGGLGLLMEQKFSRSSTPAILLVMYCVMVPLMIGRLGTMKMLGETIVFPSGILVLAALAGGVLYFFADYSYFGAFASGGSLMLIMPLAAMSPVMASLLKWIILGKVPNWYSVTGMGVALIAIVLVAYGESR